MASSEQRSADALERIAKALEYFMEDEKQRKAEYTKITEPETLAPPPVTPQVPEPPSSPPSALAQAVTPAETT
jgi:hypothetical protein